MILLEGFVVKVMIIISYEVHCTGMGQRVIVTYIIRCCRYRTRSVKAFHNAHQLMRDFCTKAIFMIALLHDFIANTPDHYARMVAIAKDLIFEVAFVPLLPIKVVVKRILLFLPNIK